MALFKILKGQEKNLPANKTEGWAYVTTDEGNMYVDVSASKRVKIGAHADKADVATKAEGDTKSIREIYLAKLKQVTSDGTTFSFRGETGNGTNAPDLISIPLAGDKAGLISNAAQTIKGNKTFANGISFPTIATWPTSSNETYPIKSQGLSWSGSSDNAAIFYEVQASDKGMLVIESGDDTNAGLEIRNAASKKKVTIVDGRFIGDLTGTADYASKAQGDSQTIRSKYVSSVAKKSGSNYIFTVTKGDGTTNDVDLYFAASASCGGDALSALTMGQGNDQNATLDANDLIINNARSKKTFYATNTDKMANRPSGTHWGYLDVGSYGTGYTSQMFINGANADTYVRVRNNTWGAWKQFAFTDGKIKNAEFADKATGDTTSIRSTYIASIKQVTSNGTTFSFRGYSGDGSEKNNLITIPNASATVAGLITTGAQTIAGNKTFTGQLIKNGVSTLWVNGRNNALLRMISINGYSPAISIKTTNGSWDIGAYNEPSYTDDLVFSYVTDANYNSGNNTASAQIKFLENGHIVASLDGNASSATKATQDGLGQNIADTYIKSITYVAHATQPKLKYIKGSGGTTELNMPIASATNAGLITTDVQTIAGDKTFTGMIYFPNATSGLAKGIQWTVGDNDYARIRAGATASNNGYLEIATADDATEPIYVRQYSGVFATLKRTLTLLDTNGNTRIPGSLYDKNNQELRANLFLASLFTKTSTGTQLTIGGKNTAGTELSTITIPNASTSVAGLITNSDQSIKGTKTLDDGMLIIKPVGRSNYQEGIRILAANNGWTTLAMGGSATSGTNASIWSIHTYQSNFYIAHNGSNSSSTGILQSDANGHWRIDNSLGIGGKNAAYKLYVNGTSYFTDLITTSYGAHHKGILIGTTYINAIGGEVIFQNNTAIRFGADNWDYDKWAGLKYTAGSKTISLGIADKTVFVANSAQTQGTLEIVQSHVRSNVDNIYDLGTTAARWRNINLGTAIRQSNRSYPWIGSAAGSKYYKVTLPYNGISGSANKWFMISMEITVGGPYSSGESGKIELSYYFVWDGTGKKWSANNVKGIAVGINMSTVKIYYDIANPAIFYIYAGQDRYRGVQISNMLVHDSAPGYDFTQTKIETCADITVANFTSIPIVNLGISGTSLYTTSPIYININDTRYPILRWNKNGTYWGGIGYNGVSNENYFGPCDAQGNWVASHDAERWRFLGALKIQNCGHTLTVGNLNADWTHFETTCSKFYFNHQIAVDGDLYPYTNNNRNLGLSSNYWNKTRSQWIYANAAGSSTDGGITLYANGDTNYGIFFRGTGNMGTHGSVTADWATYFTMSNTTGRGWVFRNTGIGNVASISAQGHMTVNSSIGINGTNVGYKLYVNGTSWVHGTLWTGHLYPESNNTYECGNGSYYWSSMSTRWLHANRGGSNADGGITLYGTSPDYGIMFRGTSNQGAHGWVTSDWATYFTMNNRDNRGWIFRRYNSKNVFSIDTNGYVWADGSLRANAVGKDGFATYPRGGHYSTSTSSVTGYLRIQLPVYRSNTMMKFIVDIYNYADNTSVSYAISGYNYQDGAWHSCTAECLSHHGQNKQNLTVAFGEMNNKSAIMIGSANTTWSYPQVQIRDIVLGFNNWNYKYWNNADWVIDFSTSPIGNVTRSLSGTDNIKISRGQFDQLVVINDSSNNEYDGLAYFRNYSASDWTMIIDKNNTYDYGLDIRTAGTYALRVNGSSRFKNSATFGVDAAPAYTVDVRGNMRSTGRIYSNEWIQFDNYTGLYSPLNNAHFYPNNTTNYGQWKILGSKNGYSGIQFGDSTGYMTVMDNGNDKGLYQQDQGMWMFYYNKARASVSLRTASVWWSNAVNINGGLYVNGAAYFNGTVYEQGQRFIRREQWWNSGDTHNCDDLRSGVTFSYTRHKTPTTGILVAFSCNDNENYTLQLQGAYGSSNSLYFRNRNGDNNTWGAWKTVIDSSNYTSYTDPRYIRAINKNGYYGVGRPDGNDSDWIRTTGSGLLPYQSGSASAGHQQLGTSSWYFSDTWSTRHNAGLWLHTNRANSGTDGGITLYNAEAQYGIMFRQTSNLGTHGWVNNDWATYFTMSNSSGRGWVFRRWGSGNVMSISTDGNMNTNGAIYAANYIQSGNRIFCGYDSTVAGSISCSNWFYSSGNTGWYNATYGGGIYMVDSTWIRTYNGKNFYCSSVIGAGNRIYAGYDSGVTGSVSCNNWFRSSGNSGWYNQTHDVGIYADNSTYLKSYAGKIFHSSRGILADSTVYYGINSLQYFNVSTSTTSGATTAAVNPYNDWFYHIRMNHANGNGYYGDQAWCFHSNNAYYRRVVNGSDQGWVRIWLQGNAVTGAVWNDYAECRKSDSQEPGYVMFEKGDDSLSKTIERLQHFAGIVSDTWGFSQGETTDAKTNIAVAGRVLAYPYRDRSEYKPGDCVCAAPGGKVDIMTREEIMQYPDRIVGTVSCVPDYEEWGGGELADRDPVKVNGRIWIKVR